MSELSHKDLEQAEYFVDIKRYEKALPLLKKYIQNNFEDPYAFALLGLCHINLGHDLQIAESVLEQALALAPNYGYAHYLRGYALMQQEKLKKAEAAFLEAIRLDPEAAGYRASLAQLYHNRNQHKKAWQLVREGLALDPNHGQLLRIKASLEFEELKEGEGMESLKKGLRENPHHTELLVVMGYKELDEKRYKDAEETFLQVLRQDPDYEEARQGLFEARKAKNWLFRLFANYGFSRWKLKFSFWMIIFLFFFIRAIYIWVPLVSLFLLFTWYGDVLYSTIIRLSKKSRYLLAHHKLVQSNFFIALNVLSAILFLVGYLAHAELFIRLSVISMVLNFLTMAFWEVPMRRQRRSIVIAGVVCLLICFSVIGLELWLFVFFCLLALSGFALLFSIRWIGW